VALFVVFCGILLMLGGGASLLLGFDIVMTERGSAMTIGGVIALSGGVVSLGIGFALFRLAKIQKALEARGGRLARPAPLDRPVVPFQEESGAPQPAREDDSALRPALGAAVAAGAAAAASAGHGLPAPSTETIDHAAADTTAHAAAVPADLEAELSRALSDIDSPPQRSFSEGLSELLARDFQEPAERSAPEPGLVGDEPTRSLLVDDNADLWAPATHAPRQSPGSVDHDMRSVSEADEAGRADADPAGEGAAREADPDSDQDPPSNEKDRETLEAEDAASPQQVVLGSYTIGDCTYRMFADGSVEAATERGVERFSSMDELRRHLAGT